jgi:ABC-type Fe2+-enterobactin transport system substrate-binding protein
MSYPELLSPEEKLADARERLNIPEIVVICGSTRFMAEMTELNLQETAAGRIVLAPGCNMKQPHPLWADPAQAERLKVELDALHRAKIRLADRVLVVGDYVGDSTRAEIAYAQSLGKLVEFGDAALSAEFNPPIPA